MEPIDRAELGRLLLDPDVPDSALRPYLKVEAVASQAFRPNVVVNPAMVSFGAEERALALTSLNNIARWRRQMRYRRKFAGWSRRPPASISASCAISTRWRRQWQPKV